ncbi:MAG: ABC transporter ATP-binding protein [Lachnospiraceae bacterium]|nr:ABC transporter ATP-binding protein [Lachnospiraceae bacterium]
MTEIVKMSNIKKTYDGKKYVLSGIDFSLHEGEIAIISGASGCGKSTFLNIVGLLDNMSEGDYFFNQVFIKRNRLSSYYKQRADDIGFVFQAYCLIESISVKDNILMPYLYSGKLIDRRVHEELYALADELNISSLLDKKAGLLSGGEKQRVAICRAIIKKPKLIIADEPTGNLDAGNTASVVGFFDRIVKSGTAVIIVTHNADLCFQNSKLYTLCAGELHSS